MKKLMVLAVIMSITAVGIMAEASRSQSLNGSTGLYSIPTGRIGWEEGGNVGLDFGYRAIVNNDAGAAHIPAITVSLFKWIELSSVFDIQPDIYSIKNDDFLFGVKLKLPTKNTAVSLGGSVQMINLFDDDNYFAYQPYLALTYPGTFFNMPAETTLVFGKTLYSGGPRNNSNIDFGMGFDIVLFPDVLGNIFHLIIDFANFGYSDNAWPNNGHFHSGPAWYRGVLNLGFRFDISAIPALKNYKFVLDLVFNDLFDDWQRSFTVGGVFGLTLK